MKKKNTHTSKRDVISDNDPDEDLDEDLLEGEDVDDVLDDEDEEESDSEFEDDEFGSYLDELDKKPKYDKSAYEEIIDPVTGKKKKIYIDPVKLETEIRDYYAKEQQINDDLANMMMNIATKLSFAPNFINYSFRKDMIGDAAIRMVKALQGKKFKLDMGYNPFSYFTRIAFNCFRARIKKEKKHTEVLENYRKDLMTFSENYNNMVKNNRVSSEKNAHPDED